jgi:serine/threonine protein kinase/tetratricopeptide (TPR) repeat protein
LAEDDITQSIHPSGPRLRRGDRLAGRFVVVQFLARGGMGEVYEASDEHLQGKHCALKTLRVEMGVDAAVQQRFEREVLLAREVNHPNVCPTYDIFREEEGGLLFLTMKLLRGESLRARLKRPGRIEAPTTFEIARQMAAGLDAAHKAGIVHRDFKPGNVMLERAGEQLLVSITDFGLSRLYESDNTIAETGRVSGTIGYIAPELLEGRMATPAADVYAYGVVLHEMLTGDKPSKHFESVPAQWLPVVRGCLESDPGKRFQSAGEAMAAFGGPDATSGTSIATKLSSRRALIGVSAAVAAGAGAIWLRWPEVNAKVNSLLHPLPDERFVALLTWPPDADAETKPLLRTVLDAIDNRLTRAEAALKKFAVIAPGAAGLASPKAMSEVVSSLGANLVLGASLHMRSPGYWLALRVFNAASGSLLRKNESQFAAADVSRLAEAASIFAAELLDVPPAQSVMKDQDEMARLPPAAYQMFAEAEELRSQPNDKGLDGAVDKYQKLLEAEPRFALGYADLSLAYIRKFQLGKDQAFLNLAEKNAALAVQYNPESAKGVLAAAVVDLERGKTQQAMDGFARALQLDPGNPLTLLFKARAFADLAQVKEEEGVYREVVRLRPNYWLAYNDLGYCLFRQTRYQEAADAFAQGAAVAPRVALPLTNLGTAYLAMHKDKDAEDAFRRSLERAPNELAYSNMGSLAFKQGSYKKAIEDYSKAIELNPKNHRSWRNLADSYSMVGDSKKQLEGYAKAAEILSDTIRVNPKPGTNWATLSFYHAKLGRKSEADLNAADQRGLDQRGQFAKAQTLAVLGRKQEALDLVLKLIDHGLSTLDVDLALDLKQVRGDPKYRSRIAAR